MIKRTVWRTIALAALVLPGCCANPYWWPGGRNYAPGIPVGAPTTVVSPGFGDVYVSDPTLDGVPHATAVPTPATPPISGSTIELP